MAVFIMLTKWEPPRNSNAREYWYRSGIVLYHDEFVEENLRKLLRADDTLGHSPAIGAYIGREKEDLPPCYLEVAGMWRYEHSEVSHPNIIHIKFHGNYLRCSSRKFRETLRKVKRTDALLFTISIKEWEEMRKELNLQPPQWWLNLLKVSTT